MRPREHSRRNLDPTFGLGIPFSGYFETPQLPLNIKLLLFHFIYREVLSRIYERRFVQFNDVT